MDKKVKTARLSVLSNSALIIIKLVAGLLSGSVSIISEAVHSGIDLVAAVMAFYSVKVSGNPPDKEHPYGHGKFENVSGVIEAGLIFIASIWIIYEAINRLSLNKPVGILPLGVAVMAISSIVNILLSRKLNKVSKETDSIALKADALEHKADIFTSAGVAISLLIIWITGLNILDPIVAILVSLFIIREAFILLKIAFNPLVDATLSDEDIKTIENIIINIYPDYIKFHQLRTRKSGFKKFVDLHLEVPENMSVKESHDICNRIEKEIELKIKNIEVVIHVEPLSM